MVRIELKRRNLLKGAVLAAGAALAGYQLGRLRQPGDPFPGPGAEPATLVLTRREAALLEHIGRAILPPGAAWPSLRQAEVVKRLDEELFFTDAPTRKDFSLALRGVENLPLLYGYFDRFQHLGLEAQRSVMARAENTRSELIRAAVNGVRMAINLVYFGHPATWSAIQYDGSFEDLPQHMSQQRTFYRSLQQEAES